MDGTVSPEYNEQWSSWMLVHEWHFQQKSMIDKDQKMSDKDTKKKKQKIGKRIQFWCGIFATKGTKIDSWTRTTDVFIKLNAHQNTFR